MRIVPHCFPCGTGLWSPPGKAPHDPSKHVRHGPPLNVTRIDNKCFSFFFGNKIDALLNR